MSDPYLTQAAFDGFQANFEAFQRKLDRQFEAVNGRLDTFERRVDARFGEVAGQLDGFTHRLLKLDDAMSWRSESIGRRRQSRGRTGSGQRRASDGAAPAVSTIFIAPSA
jgi:uncharacterized membrane-anchored protein YhcB (DUF1043 family)